MLPAVYDVTGKVMFITGAGRGIGKGIAQVLAAAGADVVLGIRLHDWADPVSGWRVKPVNGMSNQPSACSKNLVLTALVADCFLPLQLLIFERHEIASGNLPCPIRLLLHGVESHDGDPIRPHKQHSLCRLACQGVEVTKHDLAWTIDRLVPGLDHSHKTCRCLELRLNLGAGQSKSADCIVLTQGFQLTLNNRADRRTVSVCQVALLGGQRQCYQ
jgi:hypothetical protein